MKPHELWKAAQTFTVRLSWLFTPVSQRAGPHSRSPEHSSSEILSQKQSQKVNTCFLKTSLFEMSSDMAWKQSVFSLTVF